MAVERVRTVPALPSKGKGAPGVASWRAPGGSGRCAGGAGDGVAPLASTSKAQVACAATTASWGVGAGPGVGVWGDPPGGHDRWGGGAAAVAGLSPS
jgi:hypothetical protein